MALLWISMLVGHSVITNYHGEFSYQISNTVKLSKVISNIALSVAVYICSGTVYSMLS